MSLGEVPPKSLEDSFKSTMSVRQLGQTVRHGQKVTFLIFDGDPVTGYLAGMDDEHYFVLQPGHDHGEDCFTKNLIRKHGSPHMTIHSNSTYNNEPLREEMELIVGPFRTWVMNHVFHRVPRTNRHPERIVS